MAHYRVAELALLFFLPGPQGGDERLEGVPARHGSPPPGGSPAAPLGQFEISVRNIEVRNALLIPGISVTARFKSEVGFAQPECALAADILSQSVLWRCFLANSESVAGVHMFLLLRPQKLRLGSEA